MKCPEKPDIIDRMDGHTTCQADLTCKVIAYYDLATVEGDGVKATLARSSAIVRCGAGHSFSGEADGLTKAEALTRLMARIKLAKERDPPAVKTAHQTRKDDHTDD